MTRVVSRSRTLKAIQVITIPTQDGSVGLAMVSDKGIIYTFGEKGWTAVPMEEAPHDPTV